MEQRRPAEIVTRIGAMLWCLAPVACGGETSDTGAVDSDPASASEAPVVSEGEAAANLLYGEEAYEVRCPAGGGGSARLAESAGGIDYLQLACYQSASDPRRMVSLEVNDAEITTGATPLAWSDDLERDQFTSLVTDSAGDGFGGELTGNGGTTFAGTLTIQENGGSGGRLRGTFVLEWEVTGIIEGGTITSLADMPCSAVGAFDLTLP